MYYSNYRQFLQSEEWQECSGEMRRRAGYRCCQCGRGGLLDTHHCYYQGRHGGKYWRWLPPEEVWDEVFRVLCRGCHSKLHEKMDEYKFDSATLRRMMARL